MQCVGGANAVRESIEKSLADLGTNLIGVDDDTYGRFNRTQKRTIQAVIDMYHQQEEMLRLGKHTCDNRIVSIHQPHVRPIVRGKAKAKVEFGAKIGVSIVGGYTFIDHHSWEAYNEASDLTIHIEKYKERFGIEPKRFFGDKIYLNRDNRKTLKEKGIEIMGRPLGRPPKNPTEEQLERERVGVALRNEAEAQFGTGKRAYRANNIRQDSRNGPMLDRHVLLRQESGKVHERTLSCPYRNMVPDTSFWLKSYKSINRIRLHAMHGTFAPAPWNTDLLNFQ